MRWTRFPVVVFDLCTGGTCGTNSAKDLEQLRDFIRKIEAYLDAALAYGQYPIR